MHLKDLRVNSLPENQVSPQLAIPLEVKNEVYLECVYSKCVSLEHLRTQPWMCVWCMHESELAQLWGMA